MQSFQGKKLKIPHGASSQQTDAALSRLQVLGCRMNRNSSRFYRHARNRKSKNNMVTGEHGNVDEVPVFLALLHLKKQ
jgi:hypothetical protein